MAAILDFNLDFEHGAAMATSDTLDAKFCQNPIFQYILVKVATIGRYFLKYHGGAGSSQPSSPMPLK